MLQHWFSFFIIAYYVTFIFSGDLICWKTVAIWPMDFSTKLTTVVPMPTIINVQGMEPAALKSLAVVFRCLPLIWVIRINITYVFQCGVGEGDCENDQECQDGLKCGSNNCDISGNPRFDETDDCCEPLPRCYGQDNCCTTLEPCDIDEGDCFSDHDCKGNYIPIKVSHECLEIFCLQEISFVDRTIVTWSLDTLTWQMIAVLTLTAMFAMDSQIVAPTRLTGA